MFGVLITILSVKEIQLRDYHPRPITNSLDYLQNFLKNHLKTQNACNSPKTNEPQFLCERIDKEAIKKIEIGNSWKKKKQKNLKLQIVFS